MRCDCAVVRLFFTLHTQREPLLTSVGKTVKFLMVLASGPHTRVYTQEPIISPLVLHGQGAWGVAEGRAVLEARIDFFKLGVFPGRCPVESRDTVHLQRIAAWPPIYPSDILPSSIPARWNQAWSQHSGLCQWTGWHIVCNTFSWQASHDWQHIFMACLMWYPG